MPKPMAYRLLPPTPTPPLSPMAMSGVAVYGDQLDAEVAETLLEGTLLDDATLKATLMGREEMEARFGAQALPVVERGNGDGDRDSLLPMPSSSPSSMSSKGGEEELE